MAIRVPTNYLRANLQNVMSGAISRILRVQNDIATGRTVRAASDDPLAAIEILDIRSTMRRNSQYAKNIVDAQENLVATEAGVQSTLELLLQVKEIALSAANDGAGIDRDSVGAHIDSLLEDLVNLGNLNHRDHYLFGGKNYNTPPLTMTTSVSSEPFTLGAPGDTVDLANARIAIGSMIVMNDTGTVTYTEGTDYTVDYATGVVTTLGAGAMGAGNYAVTYETETASAVELNVDSADFITRVVGSEYGVEVNETANSLFGGGASFEAIVKLKNALWKDDSAGVQALLPELETAIESMTERLGSIGGRVEELNHRSNLIEGMNIRLDELKSNLEDTDLAFAALQLSTEQAAYEAALSASARLMTINLTHFL